MDTFLECLGFGLIGAVLAVAFIYCHFKHNTERGWEHYQ